MGEAAKKRFTVDHPRGFGRKLQVTFCGEFDVRAQPPGLVTPHLRFVAPSPDSIMLLAHLIPSCPSCAAVRQQSLGLVVLVSSLVMVRE
jgi:hypothetical protein